MANFVTWLIGPLALLAMPAMAQHKDNNPDWSVRCETTGDKRCYLVQNVFLEENHQRLATMAISRQGSNYFALVSVPLGVNLPAGALVTVGYASPVPVVYQICNSKVAMAH